MINKICSSFFFDKRLKNDESLDVMEKIINKIKIMSCESDKFWNLICKWFHFAEIFEYRKNILFENFILIIDNIFIILRHEMIMQWDFEVIKDVYHQDDLINHISIKNIEYKIKHCKIDFFILFNLNKYQIITHFEKSNIDNSSIICFIIIFTGLHWFCHESSDRFVDECI